MYCPRKNSSGFTIIELLVTVVIIGVLATIVTLSYVNLSSRATSAALQSDLRSAATQLEIDKTQNGDYPATDVDANGGKGLPKSSGTSYQYTYSNGQYYLSATSGMMAFYTSSLLGTITSGVWSGHIPPGGGVIWSQISINQQHSCGVASDGKAYCWGVNNQGQLGNGTKTDSMTLAPVDMTGALNGLTVSNIAVGSNHTCAIASDSYVYCWGSTTGDAVGIDWTIYGYWKTTPTAITTSGALGTKTVKSLKTGFNHNCVIASDNNVYCWGGNSNGQLGNNSTSSSYAPVAIDTSGALSGKTIKSLSAGGYTTCVIASDDKPYCWGYNNYGQLGNNSTSQST
ncbi:prepilin-type N-terminal cleavage/methylation domain-containing protein, partial [Candidatus Saccharibacteria bacterium]|nr:prepilin-type N-terminal cleavage/methylation domain-containing protein [Candidatus Saccharibacteria bacterium]